MFRIEPTPILDRPRPGRAALAMGALVYHSTVRELRRNHGNAALGLILSILQNVFLVAIFFLMFTLLGTRHIAIRGDFVLYLMSGVFLYMTHAKAVTAVTKADGPTSPMMQHAPLNPFITTFAAALSALYLQVLSLLTILFLYDVLWSPVTIDQPVGALAMLMLAWLSGVGVGLVLAALKPWFPEGVGLVATIYSRVSVFTSGKMFVGNSLPGTMLPFFDWNPLFHLIDQTRGYVFLNYFPHFSSWEYALWVTVPIVMIGVIGLAHTQRHASASWGNRR